jgi:hypothetical protein
MISRKVITLLALFVATSVTPAFAQILWNNQSPAGITDDIWGLTYANGTFAATTTQGKVLTSIDGLTWSSQVVASGTWLVSIAYGNGTWVAVGANGTILSSTNLQTWSNAKAATTNKLNGVLYNGTVWLAVGDSATILTSTDTINWTVQPVPPGVTGFLHGITLIPNTSTQPYGTNGFLVSGAVAGNGTGSVNQGFVMIGSSLGTNFSSYGYGSVNGAGNLEAVLYGPAASGSTYSNITVAAGWLGSLFYNINNSFGFSVASGFTKTPTVVPNVVYRGLAYGAGFYVAAGEQGTILTSTDGINWTQRFSGSSPSALSTSTLLGAAYSSTLQRFVVVGTGGTILASNATLPVFGNVSTRGFVSSTQTFIGGFVIQGTGPRNVLIRGDGPILASFGVTSPLPDPVLTVYNASGTIIANNTAWGSNTSPSTIAAAATAVGAFPLTSGGLDSAVLLNLQPGAYTVQITSAKGNSGIALFEAYTY